MTSEARNNKGGIWVREGGRSWVRRRGIEVALIHKSHLTAHFSLLVTFVSNLHGWIGAHSHAPTFPSGSSHEIVGDRVGK